MVTSVRPEVQQLLDEAVRDTGLPGIAIEIRNGDHVQFGAAGVANRDTGEPREQHHQFRIGSATKSFTATILLQLVADQALDLEDTVEKWLPGMIKGNGYDGNAITIKQLLDMTSGLFVYTMDAELMRRFLTPAFLDHRFDRFSPEELVEISLRNSPHHRPGRGWTYTNTGYVLAAMIIEQLTSSTYAEQVAQRITGPLGLTSTYVPGDDTALRGPHTRHYSKFFDPAPDAAIHDVTEMSADIGWSAGGIVSTLSDLNAFFAALLGGDLLPKAQLEQLLDVGPMPAVKWLPDTGYGLGAAAFALTSGERVWGNGGAINGSFCLSLGARDGSYHVTQHVNGEWGDPIAIFRRVLDAEFAARE